MVGKYVYVVLRHCEHRAGRRVVLNYLNPITFENVACVTQVSKYPTFTFNCLLCSICILRSNYVA